MRLRTAAWPAPCCRAPRCAPTRRASRRSRAPPCRRAQSGPAPRRCPPAPAARTSAPCDCPRRRGCRPHATDRVVGGGGGEDFAAHPVTGDGAREALPYRSGEVARQLLRQVRILRHVRGEQVVIEPDLAVGEEDRQLRTRESAAALAALG